MRTTNIGLLANTWLLVAILSLLSGCGDKRSITIPPQDIPDAVDIITATKGTVDGKVQLQWRPIDNAVDYQVKRCELPSEQTDCGTLIANSCKTIGETQETSYSDSDVVQDLLYCYAVASCSADACAEPSKLELGFAIPSAPEAQLVATIRGPSAAFSGHSINLHAALGGVSTDEKLTYSWSELSSTGVVLADAHSANPSVQLPVFDSVTEVELELTASVSSSGQQVTAIKRVQVQPDSIILKTADSHLVGDGLAPVYLQALATIESGDTPTYQWQQLQTDPTNPQPSGTITGADTANPSFIAPNTGNLADTFTLRVTATAPLTGISASKNVSVLVTREAPVVDLGTNIVAYSGETVTLTANPVAGLAPYQLSFSAITGPAPSPVMGDSQTGEAVVATFLAPEVSVDTTLSYTVAITAANGLSSSALVDVLVKPLPGTFSLQANSPIILSEGEYANLSASASESDVAFSWVQTSGTPTILIEEQDKANTYFLAPDVNQDSDYSFEVTAIKGSTVLTSEVLVKILDVPQTVSAAPVYAGTDVLVSNHAVSVLPLVAQAGPSQAAFANVPVTLSAQGLKGVAPYSYSWLQTSGTSVTLSPHADSNIINFTTPSVAVKETLIFNLTVTDTFGSTATEVVGVEVMPEVKPLTVEAHNISAIQNQPSNLQVLASGGVAPYHYAWSPASQAGGNLTDVNSSTPSITPTLLGQFSFNVLVTDSNFDTAQQTVVLSVNKDPNAPALLANITPGSNVLYSQGSTELDLSITGGVAPYSVDWSQVAGEPTLIVQPSAGNNQKASISAPMATGPNNVAEIQALVTDANSDSFKTILKIPVLQSTGPFVVRVNGNQSQFEGKDVQLLANAQGGKAPFQYTWTQELGPAANLSSSSGEAVTATLPEVSSATELKFTVKATDALGNTDTAEILVLVADASAMVSPDTPPLLAVHAKPITSFSGYKFSMQAAATGGVAPYSYKWEGLPTVGNPSIPADQMTKQDIVLTAPTVPSTKTDLVYGYRLTVTDALGKSVSDIRIVHIHPVPELNSLNVQASVDATHHSGEKVRLSSNVTGGKPPLRYSWTANGAGALVNLQDKSNPSFIAPTVTAKEQITFTVTVTDRDGFTATDSVDIEVLPAAKAVTAWVCSGIGCILPVGAIAPDAGGLYQQACPADKPYPLSSLENNSDGTKQVTKMCASEHDAEYTWWRETSDKTECTDFNERQTYQFAFTCTYVCTKDLCNGGAVGTSIMPEKSTLFIGSI